MVTYFYSSRRWQAVRTMQQEASGRSCHGLVIKRRPDFCLSVFFFSRFLSGDAGERVLVPVVRCQFHSGYYTIRLFGRPFFGRAKVFFLPDRRAARSAGSNPAARSFTLIPNSLCAAFNARLVLASEKKLERRQCVT